MYNMDKKIGYTFKDNQYLEIVFNRIELYEKRNYRILTGYGDAILRFAAWEYLVNNEEDVFKPNRKTFKEEFGERISNLVANDNLRNISNKLALALTADGVEALIGAVYSDSGFKEAKEVAKRLLEVL